MAKASAAPLIHPFGCADSGRRRWQVRGSLMSLAVRDNTRRSSTISRLDVVESTLVLCLALGAWIIALVVTRLSALPTPCPTESAEADRSMSKPFRNIPLLGADVLLVLHPARIAAGSSGYGDQADGSAMGEFASRLISLSSLFTATHCQRSSRKLQAPAARTRSGRSPPV